MRLAVVADIHGNLDAFSAVLSDMKTCGVDNRISLGDNIGYGPESDEVMGLLLQLNILSVLGNHELVIRHPRFHKWFNPTLRKTLRQTRSSLQDAHIAAISHMDMFRIQDGARFVHGFPPKSPFLYLFQMNAMKIHKAMEKYPERICFIGHTHNLALISEGDAGVKFHPLPIGVTRLSRQQRYIINIGSVGQPRDGDGRAKYVIWDVKNDTIDVRAVPYDIENVIRKIRQKGFPDDYGVRLRGSSFPHGADHP